MSILEAQASTMEVPTPDAFEGHGALDVQPLRSPSSTTPDDDIPPGTAGRAAALGLQGWRARDRLTRVPADRPCFPVRSQPSCGDAW